MHCNSHQQFDPKCHKLKEFKTYDTFKKYLLLLFIYDTVFSGMKICTIIELQYF